MNAEKRPRIGAIIVASGSSRRMHGMDKISANLAGKPLIQWSLECFERSKHIDEIVLVLSRHNISFGRKLIRSEGWEKVKICLGGLKRQDSTKAGLHDLHPCDFVVVHDGARPCITNQLLENGIHQAFRHGSAVAAVPAINTSSSVGADLSVIRMHDKLSTWDHQTPQIFGYDALKRAFEMPKTSATDEAGIVAALGERIRLYRSSYDNVKVTVQGDLARAEQILLLRQLPA